MSASTLVSVGHQSILLQLAMMKFHDRRAEVKKHRRGKTRAKNSARFQRATLDAVVLHAMSFDRGDTISDLDDYDGVNTHFAVLRSGDTLYLHDVSEYLFASHDFNDRGIAIEFAGNPPDERGEVFIPEGKKRGKTFGPHIPTIAQIEAGRELVRILARCYALRFVHGHKQSCGGKICPGPHIWFNVGRWAVENLGLSDGGAGFRTSNDHCSGRVIPASWAEPKYDLFAGLGDLRDRYLNEIWRATPIP